MKRRMVLLASLAALVFGLAGAGLAQDLLTTVTPPTDPCAVKWGLATAGNAWPGYVTVTNDCNNLIIHYELWYNGNVPPEAQPFFGQLHMWAGNDLLNVPMDAQGNLNPSQFCSALGGACFDATGLRSYTWVIPLSQINLVDAIKSCNSKLYIVVLAEVDMDGNPATPGFDIACAGNYLFQTGTRYWNYGEYTICCNGCTPPLPCYKTAFAKGGWVWTTDSKANPESLPSLGLTKNRWGWAINLTSPMTTPATYPIYAGAGLNNTSKGLMVGTLEVLWNGTTVSVKYTMIAGYKIEEIHIYAGDTPPTTTAPGQYGYVDSFDPAGVSSIGPIVFTVSDSNGDGIWLVAHAVVAVPCAK